MSYVIYQYEEVLDGELTNLFEVDHYCSPYCLRHELEKVGITDGILNSENLPLKISYGNSPGAESEAGYSVYCGTCSVQLYEEEQTT